MKRFVLYPFLFVIYLIVNLVVANMNQLDPALAWSPLFISLASTAVGVIVFSLLLKNWHYGGYLIFLVLIFFFLFGHLNRVVGVFFPQARVTQGLVLLAFWWLLRFVGTKEAMGTAWRCRRPDPIPEPGTYISDHNTSPDRYQLLDKDLDPVLRMDR